MKRPLVFVMIILMLATLACSVNIDLPNINIPSSHATVGATETFTVNEAAPSGTGAADITIEMGAGELNITPGATNLMSGTVEYNVAGWKPTLDRQGDTIVLHQDSIENMPLSNDTVNKWDLSLSNTVPMALAIRAGAYKASVDLSGVPLTKLDISDGASDAKVVFNSLNPQTMSRLTYRTGASQVEMTGLANANFSDMLFESGAGNYTLDFGGTLQQDASVQVKSGISQVTIIVPAGMHAQVTSTNSVSSINVGSGWSNNSGVYETSGSGPLLSIEVNMGLGNLSLEQH